MSAYLLFSLPQLAVVGGLFFLLWLASLWLRDASIVDPFWGLGFVVLAWVALLRSGATGWRPWTLTMLATVWGLRLSLWLAWRNWGHGEDRRYAAMRAKHGAGFAWVSLATVFVLQAVILWWIAWPLQATAWLDNGRPFGWLDGVAAAIWLSGLLFEAVGDWQLASFLRRRDNNSAVLDRGLWRYTRHPNYFGDCCVWWGHYLLAVAGGAWWTGLSPLLMTLLLLRVSGVALLERDIHERRPAYREYVRRTNAFFPGLPKNPKQGEVSR